MQGSWKNITGGTKGSFSIFNNANVNIDSSSNDDKDKKKKSIHSADEKNSNYKTLTLTVEKSALLNFFNSSNGHEWKKSTTINIFSYCKK